MNKLANKRIAFLTGTRADFGKIKSLISITEKTEGFDPYIFVTGMHLQHKYGHTVEEIRKCNFKNIYTFDNYTDESTMDLTLAKTIEGFSKFIKNIKPDMIVIHGDRVEALSGAIVGAINNVLVGHIEGGELSGTIDDLIRHSTSKMSHIHFVCNNEAQKRLEQMGENHTSIFQIGSPDLDLMVSTDLPSLSEVKRYYEIPFDNYAIAMFHPVTTEYNEMHEYAREFVDSMISSGKNYVVIYPNNDRGNNYILEEYKRLDDNKKFRIFPSIRFEYFLTLLKEADLMIGNSSAGVREAPFYGIPVVNIGTRQSNRASNRRIENCSYNRDNILTAIDRALERGKKDIFKSDFGKGNSSTLFIEALKGKDIWDTPCQKQFIDID